MGITVLEIHTQPRHGFFSAFFGVLRALRECEEHGWVPKVVWDSKSPYHAAHENEPNAWLQYFEPVSGGVPEALVERVCREEFCGWDGLRCYPEMTLLDTLIVLYHKYIRIRTDVWNKVPSIPSETIGVHYRGTDKVRTGEYAPPPIDQLVRTLQSHSVYTQKPFFFSTDDVDAFTVMKRAFPTMMHTQCIRGSLDQSVHGHYEYVSEIVTPTRDGPLKGMQVLVDALALSRCKHLVRCPSGVSLFAIVSAPQGKLTWMDYTEHVWEHFLLQSPRNILYYNVLHPRYRTHIDGARHAGVVWISNRGSPDEDMRKRLHEAEDRDVYLLRGVHELVSAQTIYDPECMKFAKEMLQNLLPDHPLTVEDDTLCHQPIISSTVPFTIVCKQSLWDTLESRVLRPLQQGRVEYHRRTVTLPIPAFPGFVLLLLSLCGLQIGLL